PGKAFDVQLHWSEYVQGQWTTHESSGLPVSLGAAQPVDPATVLIHVSLQGDGDGVYVHLGEPASKAFFLAGRNTSPEFVPALPPPPTPYEVDKTKTGATRYHGTAPFQVTFAPRTTTRDGRTEADPATASILRKGTAFALLPCDNDISIGPGLDEIAKLMKP